MLVCVLQAVAATHHTANHSSDGLWISAQQSTNRPRQLRWCSHPFPMVPSRHHDVMTPGGNVYRESKGHSGRAAGAGSAEGCGGTVRPIVWSRMDGTGWESVDDDVVHNMVHTGALRKAWCDSSCCPSARDLRPPALPHHVTNKDWQVTGAGGLVQRLPPTKTGWNAHCTLHVTRGLDDGLIGR